MDDVKRIVRRALQAAIIFFSHAGLAAAVYITFFLLDWLIHWLGETDKLFWTWLPVRYMFDTIDFGMIALLGVAGIFEAAKELFRHDDKDC
jgi:hypothetical protein